MWKASNCDCHSVGPIIYHHVCLINTSRTLGREWLPWPQVRGIFSPLLISFMNAVHPENGLSEHCSWLEWNVPIRERVPILSQDLFSKEQQGEEMKENVL